MTPNRPYLLRGLYEWIIDNKMTPHIILNVERINTDIPMEHIEDGRIVLNIHPAAVQDLEIGNKYIRFKTRFSGRSVPVVAEINAVVAIYTKENGKGMIFPVEEDEPELPMDTPEEQPKGKKPHLKIVK